MRTILPVVICLALAAALTPPALAQTGYPMITSVYPLGCQRGKTTEITVTGQQNFADAYAVLFEKPGISAEVVPFEPVPKPGETKNSVKLRVTATPEAVLGAQEIRVITRHGASTVGQVVVGEEPQIEEKEPNNQPAEAAPIILPVMVNGKIQAGEDVDRYRFTAGAGDQVAFRCLCARLEDKIHDLEPGGGGMHADPILVLTDEAGREVAVADDYQGPDPLLVHKFEKAGTYTIQIRDVRYQGRAQWTYTLTCTRQPFITNLYPMAGQRGKQVTVQPVGFNLGGMTESQIEVPMAGGAEGSNGEMAVRLKAGSEMTNPAPFLSSDLPQVLETPENDSFPKGTPCTLPCGLNGRIETANDVDYFRFSGKKGARFTFEVRARRFESTLDSYLEILNASGNVLAGEDDTLGKDSRIDWTVPEDGEYAARIRDLHSGGGDSYVYNLAVSAALPDFEVRCDDDKALIGPGSGYAMYALANRRNGFDGEIKLSVEGLPPGVTAAADRIPGNMSCGCVVLRAAPDAKPAFSRIRMWASGERKRPDGTMETIRHEVTPLQEIYFPGGGRGPYPVATHVVSTMELSDVVVKLSANRMELKPGGEATVEVEVERRNGYAKNVILDVYLRHLGGKFADPLPPGVTLDENASKTLLSPTETKGKIVLRASADAVPIENLPIAVLGQISINFVVKVSHASEPLLLSVKK